MGYAEDEARIAALVVSHVDRITEAQAKICAKKLIQVINHERVAIPEPILRAADAIVAYPEAYSGFPLEVASWLRGQWPSLPKRLREPAAHPDDHPFVPDAEDSGMCGACGWSAPVADKRCGTCGWRDEDHSEEGGFLVCPNKPPEVLWESIDAATNLLPESLLEKPLPEAVKALVEYGDREHGRAESMRDFLATQQEMADDDLERIHEVMESYTQGHGRTWETWKRVRGRFSSTIVPPAIPDPYMVWMVAFKSAGVTSWQVIYGPYKDMADIYNRYSSSFQDLFLAPVFRGPMHVLGGDYGSSRTGQAPEKPDERVVAYSDIRDSLKGLPMTWYPALLIESVQAAAKSGAFRPGGIEVIVKSTLERMQKP